MQLLSSLRFDHATHSLTHAVEPNQFNTLCISHSPSFALLGCNFIAMLKLHYKVPPFVSVSFLHDSQHRIIATHNLKRPDGRRAFGFVFILNHYLTVRVKARPSVSCFFFRAYYNSEPSIRTMNSIHIDILKCKMQHQSGVETNTKYTKYHL